jgi:hypothetical protein
MSVEDDVRELRAMFTAHIVAENKSFTDIANFHGEIRATMLNINNRLNDGSSTFDENDTRFEAAEKRFDAIEKTMERWKGWGAALIFIAAGLSQIFSFLLPKVWTLLKRI